MKNPLLVCAHQTRKVWWRVSRPFSLGALALVVDGEGRVLLVELSYRRGWYLPGGGVRKREGLDEAVRRELREEVGVVPAGPLRLQGVYWNFRDGRSDYITVFVVERWAREPARSLEIAADRFFAPGDLPDDVSPSARRRIEEYAAGASGVFDAW
jgi:8-oxo-dGTP pyrophosphatase MutT (NUDIX family)